MHEVSLVRSLLAQVVAYAEPLPPASIRKVTVASGPLSGVEPILVAQAFFHEKSLFGLDACELEIEERTLQGQCLECEHSFEIINFNFRCPRCSSTSIQVVSGDGFLLLRIEVEEFCATVCSDPVETTLKNDLRSTSK